LAADVDFKRSAGRQFVQQLVPLFQRQTLFQFFDGRFHALGLFVAGVGFAVGLKTRGADSNSPARLDKALPERLPGCARLR